MTDRPIIFSAPMVRALLDGSKTQTRRVVEGLDPNDVLRESPFVPSGLETTHGREVKVRFRAGDLLWVKERYAKASPHGVRYEATDDIHELRKRVAARFMPRWASRLTLLVTDARVQKLQEISTDDCIAEGIKTNSAGLVLVEGSLPLSARAAYRDLWDSLNAKRGYVWDTNPWVFALSFQVSHANIDCVDVRDHA